MQILAHRGFWKEDEEKNTLLSLTVAFEKNYGVETDIRDFCGNLVISHDVANEKCTLLTHVLKEYNRCKSNGMLALNVKSDGIQILLKPLLEEYRITNYFLFDMSIPEMVVTRKACLKYYTRHSDIEHECVLYDSAQGVWLDSFYDKNWLTKDVIEFHIKNNKKICIVSPELHGYEHDSVWRLLRDCNYQESDIVTLCTDMPDEARRYFYE